MRTQCGERRFLEVPTTFYIGVLKYCYLIYSDREVLANIVNLNQEEVPQHSLNYLQFIQQLLSLNK